MLVGFGSDRLYQRQALGNDAFKEIG